VVGLGSQGPWLKIARDEVRDRPDREWFRSYNGHNTAYPSAARVGHDGKDLLRRLHKELELAGLLGVRVFFSLPPRLCASAS